jgi:hypothetical protein
MNARADFANMSPELAEVLRDKPLPQPSKGDVAQARSELIAEILDGKTRGGFDLNACLDCEFNSDGYTGTVNDLAALMLGVGGEEGMSRMEAATATRYAVETLAAQIVAKHLPESAVSDRAWAISNEREGS